MSSGEDLSALSRRSFLAGVGGAAATLVTSGAPAALAQTPAAIKRGGTFVESINWTYPSLDSHLSSQPFMAGFEAMYNTLVRFYMNSKVAVEKLGEDGFARTKTRITCGAPANWAQVCDPDIDKLMNEGGATMDPKKRHEIYRNVLRLVQERAYLGTGIVMPLLMAYRKEVQGLRFNFQVPNVTTTWLAK